MADQTINPADLLKRGEEIEEQIQEGFAARGAIRDTLRNLADAKMLDAATVAKVDELYPRRERKGKGEN